MDCVYLCLGLAGRPLRLRTPYGTRLPSDAIRQRCNKQQSTTYEVLPVRSTKSTNTEYVGFMPSSIIILQSSRSSIVVCRVLSSHHPTNHCHSSRGRGLVYDRSLLSYVPELSEKDSVNLWLHPAT
jgi:hypothetical protein